MRRLGIAVGLSLVGVVAAAGLYLWTLLPTPGAARQQVRDDVVGVLAGRAYAYLIWNADHVVLVDAGSDPTAAAIVRELAAIGRRPEQVEAILVTHGHFDHVSGIPRFVNARTCVCQGDHQLLRGDRLPSGLLPRLFGHLMPQHILPPHVQALLAGTALTFGDLAFDVIATPGHTGGSCMYRLRDVLFSGDSLLNTGAEVGPPPWLFSDSPASNRRALARLEAVPFTTIADGHTGFSADGRDRYERWLKANLEPDAPAPPR